MKRIISFCSGWISCRKHSSKFELGQFLSGAFLVVYAFRISRIGALTNQTRKCYEQKRVKWKQVLALPSWSSFQILRLWNETFILKIHKGTI